MSYPIDATHAGVSNKYGQVYVEREGRNGFPDRDEPVALLRAADEFALGALLYYRDLLYIAEGVHPEQLQSVEQQLANFGAWREANPDKVRKPGPPA